MTIVTKGPVYCLNVLLSLKQPTVLGNITIKSYVTYLSKNTNTSCWLLFILKLAIWAS